MLLALKGKLVLRLQQINHVNHPFFVVLTMHSL